MFNVKDFGNGAISISMPEPGVDRVVDCDSCHKTEKDAGHPMRACSRCRLGFYCSGEQLRAHFFKSAALLMRSGCLVEACQRADWTPSHKKYWYGSLLLEGLNLYRLQSG